MNEAEATGKPGMSQLRDDEDRCPPPNVLRRIGGHDMPADVFAQLEPHIEGCSRCQDVLQAWADSDSIRNTRPLPATGQPTRFRARRYDAVPEIPGFRLIRELGRGGEGVVHLAEEVQTQRYVALKFLPGGWLVDPEGRRGWLRQVRATARFQHANVVRLYGVEETASWHVMVLEYVAGGSLRDLAGKPLPPHAAATIVHKLAKAVQEIHRAGVLHLDLKPSNVLLEGAMALDPVSREPKISDFGIAMPIDSKTCGPLAGAGTPAFMAPEQAAASGESPGPTADVYGLGAILFFLLTGMPPSASNGTAASHAEVRHELPIFGEPAQSLAETEIRSICMRAMARKPRRRFATPAELATALEAWLQSSQTGDLRTDRPLRPSPPRRAAWICAVTLAVLAAGFSRWGRDHGTAATLPPELWIQELREVEPNVFFGERLDRLIRSTQAHTVAMLGETPGDPERLARTGVMLQAMAGRFVSSKSKALYGKIEDLLQASVALLKRSDSLSPGNPATTRELALAEFAFGCVKATDLGLRMQDLDAIETRNVAHIEKSTEWIDKLQSERERVYLATLVLDRCRSQAADARAKGLKGHEKLWTDLHRKCESNWADLAAHDEIRTRFELFRKRRTKMAEAPAGIDPGTKQPIAREWVALHFDPVIFGSNMNGADPCPGDMSAAIVEAESTSAAFGRTPGFVASVIYEDLIRQVSAAGSWFRAQGRLDESRELARRYGLLCQAAQARHPDRFEVYLALSEAFLQNWKNDLKTPDPVAAETSLRSSLEMAGQAARLAPGEVAARDFLEDRESRLARFLAAKNR